jgi:DNA-binding transcriptional LysR family regulator
MTFDKLARLDLNLLVCLYILLDECSVTNAAHRLHLSQSAVSKSLNRLREQFDDQLFTRTAYGIEPTQYTLDLAPQLETLLSNFEQLMAPKKFVPATSQRHFKMAVVENSYPLFLPKFLGDIFSQAPNIILDNQSWDSDTFERLRKGELDFGLTGKELHPHDAMLTLMPPKGIHCYELCQDSQSCLVRKNHPSLKQTWDEDNYLRQRHIQVRSLKNDRWLLDYKLAEKGLTRDIAIYVPDFNNAANLCTYTDFMLTAPTHFARNIATQLDLIILPLPTPLPPMAYTLFWHQNKDKDQGHNWMRQIIIRRCKGLSVNE